MPSVAPDQSGSNEDNVLVARGIRPANVPSFLINHRRHRQTTPLTGADFCALAEISVFAAHRRFLLGYAFSVLDSSKIRAITSGYDVSLERSELARRIFRPFGRAT
jgi:hypothetical protein